MLKFGSTLSICFVCVSSAVAVGVAVVVFSVTWVFVADGELTGTGGSVASDVRGVVLGEGVCVRCVSVWLGRGRGVGGK